MATTLSTGTISEVARFDPDAIWSAEALPNATSKTSSAFKLGGAQGGIQVDLKTIEAVTVGAAETFTVVLQTSATSTGTFADHATIYATPAAGETIAADTEFASYIKDIGDDLQWAKLVVTASENLSASTVDAYLTKVAR